MPFSEQHRRQVSLLVRILPLVAQETCFALKGGTAINLFVRNMPRLSIDIDLTYLPVKPRADSLSEIDAAMKHIAERIRNTIDKVKVVEQQHEGAVTWLQARARGVQIKIEVTPVLRGCVFESERRTVSEKVENEFGFAEIQVVSWGDLYAGKIVAALDRQHPRDLFDVRDLLANEGIDDDLRTAFVVYILSHHRPMSEVLAPVRKAIGDEFMRGFDGMTDEPISLDQLLAAREAIIREMVGKMPDRHRAFLLSFERGVPDWDLLGVTGASDLPAVRWRIQNLDKLTPEKRAALVVDLEKALGRGT
ncbi:nucleotidyl transferase AbiEii/AbiGii toxin family protein [Reyranella sp. CPCC 100927]|uniref:nucleotidyl transferase AbiEii/AbiGii toxin family protein n=1 Tax=Reyranella sp. CPCC 100927 TaxID=2599616 RepID=UPI0011B6BB78|nr:nucleotidyl transferase AbiEii/AbiGii toxin family protein [Reyranella sp. CPCC 100927]TWS99840.1 nucleotidyl transferase AbiEii/AbiGii toxin family protein [Reyranella sp. CPCC 100927]